jgi:hypothetical protein
MHRVVWHTRIPSIRNPTVSRNLPPKALSIVLALAVLASVALASAHPLSAPPSELVLSEPLSAHPS